MPKTTLRLGLHSGIVHLTGVLIVPFIGSAATVVQDLGIQDLGIRGISNGNHHLILVQLLPLLFHCLVYTFREKR
jgi:hypothetical protein